MDRYAWSPSLVSRWQRLRGRVAMDAAHLVSGNAKLVTGVRFILFVATALWVPVLCIPGDTMTGSLTYDTIRWCARALGLPPVDGILSPGELLLAVCALFLTLFAVGDYLWLHSRLSRARVYFASIFWVGLASSYLIANPQAYGTWLFIFFALLSFWALRRVRDVGGKCGR